MKIYLTHYLPLKERLEFMNMQFKNLNMDVELVTVEPTDDDIRNLFCTDVKTSKLSAIRPYPLCKSEMSLAFKHYYIYNDIVEKRHDVVLILEDDAILHKNFVQLVEETLKEVPSNWDFIFLGSGWSETQPNWTKVANKSLYKKEHPAARCTDSYMLNFSSAYRLLKTLTPMHGPIDWELDRHMQAYGMNVYWRDPPIVKQGSQIGQYKETVRVEFKR